jgi:hypothetical protein
VAGQSVTFDFTSKGASQLAGDFRKTGDTAALAAKGARLLADALEKQRKASDVSAGVTLTLAKTEKILKDATDESIAAVVEERIALDKNKRAKQEAAAANAGLAASADAAGLSFSGLGGVMGAAVAAGVALSPVIATLGVGLGGLGLAAAGLARNQKLVQQTLAPLKADFTGFQDALKPVLIKDFGAAVGVAGGLLGDIEPVAKATGTALAQVLGAVGKEFQSGEWQQFFTFMAKNAGPDLQMIGQLFVQVLRVLPPFVEALQPVATVFLQVANATALAGQALEAYGQAADNFSSDQSANVKIVEQHTSAIGTLGAGFLDLIGDYKGAESWQKSFSTQVLKGGKLVNTAAVNTWSLVNAVTALTTALSKNIGPNATFNTDLINVGNSAKQAADALKTSAGRVGLHTQKERDSLTANQNYINALVTLASDAGKSATKQDQASSAIKRALPQLENVKGGTKSYWQEVRTLINYLNTLRQERNITKSLQLYGHGNWSITARQHGLAQGPGPFAAGGLVRGGTPGRDSVLARVMPGEVIVPARMVSAGLVDHLRGSLPGFATGGIVPSYSGTPGGLRPWAQHNWAATEASLTRSMGNAMARAFGQALAAAASGSGALGGDARANEALARRIFPWGASQWPPFVALVMAESGFNRYARNPSSGAYGIPQALPPGKLPFAGQAAGGSHAGPQLSWMFSYLAQRYGTPAAAWAHELAFRWYGSGFHGWFDKPTIIGVGERGRERVDITPAHVRSGGSVRVVLELRPSGSSKFDAFMADWLSDAARVRGGGSLEVAFGDHH